nr:synaptobrevin, longin-like domain protein [Tanacetum cinerariifolium]
MALTFADTHNMIAFLTKSDASAGFDQIVDFLNAYMIQLQALIDRKKVLITEDSIRQALQLDDADGIDCLPNKETFAELGRVGYEKPSTKLKFYKAFFLAQWKFLIHTILQCMSAKRTIWNEFSSSMASAVIYLATSREFNFSKYIFDSMIRNVDSPSKFLMRIGKGFSGVDTPLFDGGCIQIGREISELDADEDVTLEDVDAKVAMDANIQGRLAESQAKLMTDVVTTAATTITAPQVPKASAPRKRKGVVIKDPKETATALVIVHSKVKSKDKSKGILIEEPKPLKRQA